MAQITSKKYCAQSESYSIAMEEMFKQIPQNITRALTSREKIKN